MGFAQLWELGEPDAKQKRNSGLPDSVAKPVRHLVMQMQIFLGLEIVSISKEMNNDD